MENEHLDLMEGLTPSQIVEELNKYIIGQEGAKRAVAVALRNRWRRQVVPEYLRDEIAPKNIIMIGPTGVGKTEIARRLARLAQAPFLKVEATRFTEVGYVGRDVESMIRDLTEISVSMLKMDEMARVREKGREQAEDRVLDLLLPRHPVRGGAGAVTESDDRVTREKMKRMLREGRFNSKEVEIESKAHISPDVRIFSGSGIEEIEIMMKDIFGNIMPGKSKKRTLRVDEALNYMTSEESQKLVDMEKVISTALKRVETAGIIFIDEMDKIAGREVSSRGPDVSREGVQRDILPIVEGTTVMTKHGMVKTDHILFIAAGAFNVAKPSELIPELQGRFPIRVELSPLGKEDLKRILVEPENSLTRQYIETLKTEEVHISFMEDALDEIAQVACEVNERSENIGARRLYTIMEKLLEEISFRAPEMKGERVAIDRDFVRVRLEEIIKDEDLSRYIL